MKKRLLSALLCFCMALSLCTVSTPVAEARAEEMELVTEGYYDTHVIPDRYNTGVEDDITLTEVHEEVRVGTVMSDDGGELPWIQYRTNEGDYVINYYKNSNLASEVLIEGYKFGDFEINTTNIVKYTESKVITFKNCEFNGFGHDIHELSKLSFVFENCTFTNCVAGSNMVFSRCKFVGGSGGADALNPYGNVEVNNCYFYSFPQTNTNGTHTDGVQIAGNNDLAPTNIHFGNTRMEMPVLQRNGGYINAPLMVSLDYNDASDISFNDCIINGGGYSIYAAEKEFSLTNTTFTNISVGAGRLYGQVYPSVGEDVVMTNIYETEKLYVSSVWKDDAGKVHVITTNDTAADRTLVIATDTGVEEHVIECKATAEAKGATATEEIPIDVEIILDNAEYVVCYDTSVSAENQIRFVNFGTNQIYRKSDGTHISQKTTAELVTEGVCDTQVIPDKHNTGIEAGVTLTPYAEYFSGYCNDGESLYITQALQNNLGTVYENIEFSSVVTLNKANLTSMVFRNCKFSASAAYAVNTGSNLDSENVTVTFENCEFLNQTSACVQPTKNFKLVNCKIHDMGSDGGKVFDNGNYENCYFYNIGSVDGTHADGIQVTSNNDNFSIINCRFDMPTYNEYMANAAIFFILEEDSTNSVVKDCFAYGGNYSVYYGRKTPDAETPVVLENNTVENIIVGCGYQYGAFNDNSNSFDYSEIKDADKLFVSSVWKDGETIHLLVSNYTNEERVLKVVSDTGTKSVTIPAAPTYEEGKTYTNFSQFPFDVEVETTGDYVVCYDTSVSAENQVRFVNYGTDSVYRKSNGEHITQTSSQKELITETYRDTLVIPDKYNTGCDKSVGLTAISETGYIGTVLSDDGGNAPKFVYEPENSRILLNGYSNGSLAKESIVENYDFSEFGFQTLNSTVLSGERTVIFKNCKFDGILHDKTSLSEINLVFENCTIRGATGSNMTFKNCLFEINNGDAMNIMSNFTVEDCFVVNVTDSASTTGGHVDGVQIYGTTGYDISNVHLNNVRFAMPSYYFEGATTYVNAAIFVKMEQGDGDNILFENIIIDSAGSGAPIYDDHRTDYAATNMTFRNIVASDEYSTENSSTLFYIKRDETVAENCGPSSKLYVSSVWKDDEEKTHIICTNNSVKSDRTLKVVTDKGEYEFVVDRAPSSEELTTNATYQTYRYADMPYDVECIIDEDVDYVVCYDTEETAENQIRFVNYSGAPVYRMVRPGSGNDSVSTSENSMEINVSMYATQINVVVPLNVNCTINPNVEDGFVYGDIVIQNNSTAPMKISLGKFTQANGGFTMIQPDDIGSVENGGLSWETLNSEQSETYLSIGATTGETGWYERIATECAYADNMTGTFSLGVVAASDSALVGLDACYGRSFKEVKSLKLQMCFVAELE